MYSFSPLQTITKCTLGFRSAATVVTSLFRVISLRFLLQTEFGLSLPFNKISLIVICILLEHSQENIVASFFEKQIQLTFNKLILKGNIN